MQLPLVPYYETCDEDGPCAPYFTGHITDADGRVMCRTDSEERAIELVDCVDGLSANIETLRARLAEVEAQRDGLKVALTTANAKLADIKDALYGRGLEVLGWHLNGDTEPLDNWFGENDWEPMASEAFAKMEEK